MKLEVHLLVCDYDWITPWTLRHYGAFADKIVVHDAGPDWGAESVTRELCRCHGAGWVEFDMGRQINDDLMRKLKNTCWRGTDAEWVVVADADELLWFPPSWKDASNDHGARVRSALGCYETMGAAIIKPHGFEMFSDSLPQLHEHGQIHDAIRAGARSDRWYGKPFLFSPRRVAETGYGIGAHDARVVLKDGRALKVDEAWPKANPPAYLLHYHQIGTAEFVAARYDASRARFASINVRNGWGNHSPGAEHVAEKRALIVPNLIRVVL